MTGPDAETGTCTDLLRRIASGDAVAHDALYRLVYPELRRIARRHLRGQSAAHTLQTTALVHEAYLRLAGEGVHRPRDRAHFLAVASTAMRTVLVDHARRKKRVKRGSGRARVPLDDLLVAYEDGGISMVDLDEALRRLEEVDSRAARTVVLRYFGGLSLREVGLSTGVSTRTAERNWRFARTWLHRELS